jgi:hypothetical protein
LNNQPTKSLELTIPAPSLLASFPLIYYLLSHHNEMLLFSMYVKDEYTAKKLESACKKLSKKLKNRTYMTWQSVKDGNKLVVACDYYQEDDD